VNDEHGLEPWTNTQSRPGRNARAIFIDTIRFYQHPGGFHGATVTPSMPARPVEDHLEPANGSQAAFAGRRRFDTERGRRLDEFGFLEHILQLRWRTSG
jgi:hypothetical protein